MGRDEHRNKKGRNQTKLPQTPAYAKTTDRTGIDIEMSNDPKVQFGIAEEKSSRED
ncbi:YfhD family protein [Aquibacillus sp. 3ASR75-11]|uniref:YfhD family protein n=1 Tax=Terrihalobacillus insolitus TaxID=2950438 RepID=A0A9X4ANT0_9BACI|nr:YfhD family protein [Terrihalobacillus insolitus]MDC3414537.1 YfhD family protein [Terrihalobacillus insolitus]MDC3426129.1 YfhD family protein [Terrihalobacillus insolitus]